MKREGHDVVTMISILKVMASIYNPLGVVSPILAKAEILFQESCTVMLNWDEELNEMYGYRWR